jgi:phosphoserine aminotransferase
MKKHNFYAGPSIVSEYCKEETAKGVLNLGGSGLSIMEISHRSKEFIAIMEEATSLVCELLNVPRLPFGSVSAWWCQHSVFNGSLQLA